jgi:hypothetical protein
MEQLPDPTDYSHCCQGRVEGLAMKVLVFSLLIIAIGICPIAAVAAEDSSGDLRGRYFVVIWAYEGQAPTDSHSFASFYDGDALADGRVTPATISWLPATGAVHPLQVERGRNFSLTETLAIACQGGKRVANWGPYEIKPDLYRRALARIELLRSGMVAFSAVGFHGGTMNCIEAAGDIAHTPFRPGSSWGIAASKAIVRHLRRYFKNGGQANDIVARSVMLTECPTIATR